MAAAEVSERLQLDRFRPGFWKLQQTCAVSGDGLTDGFNWLIACIRTPPDASTAGSPT